MKIIVNEGKTLTAYDVWDRELHIPEGEHTFKKIKDDFLLDVIIHKRSWYIVDDIMLVDLGRKSGIDRLLRKLMKCSNEKVIDGRKYLGKVL
jgi:hypothetical protein